MSSNEKQDEREQIKRIQELIADGTLQVTDIKTLSDYLNQTVAWKTLLYAEVEIVRGHLKHLIDLKNTEITNKKTLFWARLAGWSAAIGTIIGIGLLILDLLKK